MIKPARLHHLPEIIQMERALFTEPWSGELLREKISANRSLFYVAETENHVLGYGILWFLSDLEGELLNIAVSPLYRRQGTGRRILEALLQESKSQGITTIHLEVRASNQAAIALYQAFGFQWVGLRKDYYNQPMEDACLMCYSASNPK